MAPAWQPCPHCKVLFTAREGSAPRTHCPACRKPFAVPLPAEQPEVRAVLVAAPAPNAVAAQPPHAGPPHRSARPHPYELWFALAAVLIITGLYAIMSLFGIPQPSGIIGHVLGIVGFLLMCSTEVLYSLRKRIHGFALGRASTWLQVHIFTGIIGPYLVLLHSAGRFHGLAGILLLLTIMMVISGFVGRYLYTAVPRTIDGAELAVRDLEHQIAAADHELQMLGIRVPPAPGAPPAWMIVLGRSVLRWRERLRVRQALQQLAPAAQPHARRLERLLAERYRVQMQMQSLATARRLMALWHLAHIPLGVVVFTFAFIHIGAAVYYATLLR